MKTARLLRDAAVMIAILPFVLWISAQHLGKAGVV